METFSEPSYYLNFIYFLVASFVAFFIPGNLILRRYKLSTVQSITYSYTLGICLWAIIAFVLGFLHVRDAIYLYFISTLILWLYVLKKNGYQKVKIEISKKDIPIIILLVVGVCVQLAFTFLNGISTSTGMYFCCGLPDSLYHIGLTNSIVNSFPPHEPAMYGVIVKNYHYLANLVEAEYIRIFRSPLIFTQYQYFPLLISLLIGFAVISLGEIWKLRRMFVMSLLIFTFFWGDITYLFTLLIGQGMNIHIPFLFDSTALWYSPPRVFALLIFLCGLGMLTIWIKRKDYITGLLVAIIFGSLVGFKVYNGIFVAVGLSTLGIYFLFKKEFRMILPIIFFTFLSMVIFFPVNNHAGGLIYSGFWRFENFISQNQFGLGKLEQERLVYESHRNMFRIIEYKIAYVFSYFIFVFGTLNICFVQTKKSLSQIPKEINIFLIPSVFVCFILGFFFLQKIGGANTSQFLIAAAIVMSIYAALSINYFSRNLKDKWKILIIFLLIIFSAPRVINQLSAQYKMMNKNEGLMISKSDIEALRFLNLTSSKESIFLSDNKYFTDDKSCYYVGFLTDRKLFICNARGILSDHGVNVEEKEADYKKMFKNLNTPRAQQLLIKHDIDYIITRPRKGVFIYENKILKKVYDKDNVRILKVDRKN